MIPRELFRKIRHVEIRTKGLVEDVFGGEYHSAFKGRGIEFAEVRPYQIGDDVRTIDWSVTARSGEPFVKLYEEEREQTLLLCVDVSASEAFGSTGTLKRELAAEVCAVLGFSAIRNQDKVGLLLFTDRVERFVPPRKGRRHVLRVIRDLYVHEPEHTGTDLRDAFEHALRVLKRRAIVVVVSDFRESASGARSSEASYEKSLRHLAARHDVVAVRVVDPREEELPSVGLVTLRDSETGQPVLIDTSSRKAREAFARRAQDREVQTVETLKRARVGAVTVRTGEDFVGPLAAFFRRRNRE
ncbi:DUF58 domain-containing protein [Rubricoccus marinus]|uniref:DUF58 domain-containing protein n=1 Tax=Rubricoccus marinus TaxID=716817 RepID=A0A259U152_9BACT|nr:DUF58 domain-containing protein [Rubricoccus marinus]OZC03666.1 hypothetical protein BSZ36_12155 [Rubricoccus marinus]